MSRVEVGKPYKITFSIDENAGTLSLTYRGKENKYFKGIGTVATLKFGISVRSGNIIEGDQAFIWLTDDENHLPVAFMAPLKVGAMNGRLTSYKNLSNDFTALISTKRVK